MDETVKLSGKGQIAIPKKIREKAGWEKGDELTLTFVDGKVILRKKPKSYTDYMLGLHASAWGGVDATDYIEKERGSWQGEV